MLYNVSCSLEVYSHLLYALLVEADQVLALGDTCDVLHWCIFTESLRNYEGKLIVLKVIDFHVPCV